MLFKFVNFELIHVADLCKANAVYVKMLEFYIFAIHK